MLNNLVVSSTSSKLLSMEPAQSAQKLAFASAFFLLLLLLTCRSRRSRRRVPSTPGLRENATLFLSAFPVFVPSLSWSNDAFCIEMAQKWRFFTFAVVDVSHVLLRVRPVALLWTIGHTVDQEATTPRSRHKPSTRSRWKR